MASRRLLTHPLAVAALGHGALALWFVLARAPGTNAAAVGFPLDDAWIHMVYGRNFASHLVPAYNDAAEAGFTSPLWMLALAVAHWLAALLPASPVFFAKLFGVACAAATSATVYELGRRLTGRAAVGIAAALLCACHPVLAFAQVSGMEVSLATLTATRAVLAVLDDRHRRAGVWLGLAYLSRPECLLLVPFVAAACALRADVPVRDRWRQCAALALPTAAAGILWAGYCLAVTGHPLPNTFYAKFVLDADDAVFTAVLELLRHQPTNLLAAGLVLALVGAATARCTRRPWLTAAIAVFPFAFAFAIARTRPCPAEAGQYFYFARYPAPAWPFLALATALGADAAWQLASRLHHRAARQGLRAATAAIAVLALARHPAGLAGAVERYGWNCQNIEEVQVAFGRWVREHVPEGRAVALNDAGAIRYFGDRYAVDLMGLNDHEVLFARLGDASIRGAGDFAATLLPRGVEYAIVFPTWFDAIVRCRDFGAWFTAEQAFANEHYTIADARSGQTRMVAYRLTQPAASPR